ncbi:putative disease resistance protein At3g14460 [Ziziphus jujuba]|uniref:Disease resistance protein At3g14460 n=1 Tax=Ziziphus jujuba TaxID=326968 RepID=A0ABM3ZXF3_ZIZJJ|nr:putative disease resistance protein At3g14460 [Ziziphus jujuba]
MAEGLLQTQRNKPLEEVGNEYLKDLVSRSFFHVWSYGRLTMHDLVNDLAKFVSGESCLRLNHDCSQDFVTNKTRHLSLWRCKSYDINILGDGCENKTLIMHSCLELTQLPVIIDSLKHLRYLDLSGSAIERMSDTRDATTTLKLEKSEKFRTICCRKNIESNIKELGKFQNLRGKLCITNLENVVNVEDVSEANLKDKKLIRELILEWKGDSAKDSHEAWKKEWSLMGCSKQVGDGVFSNLKYVTFSDCPKLNGACIPDYLPSLTYLRISGSSDHLVGSLSRCEYPSLDKLHLEYCPTMKSFPQGKLLFNIKKIKIFECNEVVSHSKEGWPCNLKSLKISQCEKVFGEPMECNLRMLTTLTSLKLNLPPNLKSLNGMGFGCLVSLQKLYIIACGEFQCLVEEDEGLPASLTTLELCYLPELKSLNASAFRNLTSLQNLLITKCTLLQCLPEERLP